MSINKYYSSSLYSEPEKNINISTKPIIAIIPEMYYEWIAPCTYIRIFSKLLTKKIQSEFDIRVVSISSIFYIVPDIVIMNRLPSENLFEISRLLEHLQSSGTRIIYDIDDLLLNPSLGPGCNQDSERKCVVEILLSRADLVWSSTNRLREVLSRFNKKIEVIANYLDKDLFEHSANFDCEQKHGIAKILYMGSATHDADMRVVLNALENLNQEGVKFEFYLIGVTNKQYDYEWLKLITPPEHAGNNNYPEFMRWLRSLRQFDFGVAPLEDNIFNQCKSFIKYWDYSSIGIATVASDFGPYKTIIKNGINGYLAGNEAEWRKKIKYCIENRNLLSKVVDNARKTLLEEYIKIDGESFRINSINKLLQNKETTIDSVGINIVKNNDYQLKITNDVFSPIKIKKIAVHLHAFYPDLVPEVVNYIINIPYNFDLFVSTDSNAKANKIKISLSQLENVEKLDIQVVKNRGRDIAPMLLTFGRVLSEYDLVLHLHTKRSPHNPDLRGWRSYLYDSLLGSKGITHSIVRHFDENANVGLMYPTTYYPIKPFMRMGGNIEFIKDLFRRNGVESNKLEDEVKSINIKDFPSGFMFWFRGEVLKPLLDMNLQLSDFANEAGQDDGTLAHAIERALPRLAKSSKEFDTLAYIPVLDCIAKISGTLPLTQFDILQFRYGHFECYIIFDKNNPLNPLDRFNLEKLENQFLENIKIIRIFRDNEFFIVQIISNNEGNFYSADYIELVNLLNKIDFIMLIVDKNFEIDRLINKLLFDIGNIKNKYINYY